MPTPEQQTAPALPPGGVSRRRLLGACLVGGAGLVAACSGGSSAPATPGGAPAPSPSPLPLPSAPAVGVGVGVSASPLPPAAASSSPVASPSPLLALSPSAGSPVAGAGVQAHVVQGLPSSDFGLLPSYVAQDAGYFADEGLTVDQPVLSTSAALAALQAGEVQFASGGGANRDAYQGAPFKTIFYGYTFPTFIVVGTPAIQTIADLKGKTVAVTNPAGSDTFALRALLQANGMALTDVNLISIGDGPQRAAGVLSGQIDATVINPDLAAKLQTEASVTILGNFQDVLPIPFNGFSTTTTMLQQQAPVVVAWLRAHVRALLLIKQQPDTVVNLAVQQFGLTPDVASGALQLIEPAVSTADPGGATQAAITLNTQEDMESLHMTGDAEQMGLGVHDFTLLRQAQRSLGIYCTTGYQC